MCIISIHFDTILYKENRLKNRLKNISIMKKNKAKKEAYTIDE